MKVDCYVLQIYCDAGANCVTSDGDYDDDDFVPDIGYTEEFTGKNRRESIHLAKKAGWIVGRHDYCPECVKARRKS